jgi:hypothetical protein
MPTVTKAIGSVHGVREGRFFEWNMSTVKMGVVDVTFGTTETYTTGGVDVATGIRGQFSDVQEIVGATVLYHNVAGFVPMYNVATGKLQFFGQEPTNTTAGVIGLSEMADGSTAISGKVVRLLFFGL